MSYGIILPIICTLGILGNVLNLVVLTRRNMRGTAYIYMRGKYIDNLRQTTTAVIVCREENLALFHSQSLDTLMISEQRQISTSSNMKQTDTRVNYVINKASKWRFSGWQSENNQTEKGGRKKLARWDNCHYILTSSFFHFSFTIRKSFLLHFLL